MRGCRDASERPASADRDGGPAPSVNSKGLGPFKLAAPGRPPQEDGLGLLAGCRLRRRRGGVLICFEGALGALCEGGTIVVAWMKCGRKAFFTRISTPACLSARHCKRHECVRPCVPRRASDCARHSERVIVFHGERVIASACARRVGVCVKGRPTQPHCSYYA